MKYLISTVETYRADSESEAKDLIETAKKDRDFILSKYSSEYKEVKSKGEVVDDFFKVSLTKVFSDLKEPNGTLMPVYQEEGFKHITSTYSYDSDAETSNF